MVKRNAICPCGSQKKYKKCCVEGDGLFQQQLVQEELMHIIGNYAAMILNQTNSFDEIEKINQAWRSKLNNLLGTKSIRLLSFEYYLYIKQSEQWNRYILKWINGKVRPETHKILSQWSRPTVLIGKVIEKDGQYWEIEEILGDQTYRVLKGKFNHWMIGDLIVGIILRDVRGVDKVIYFLNDVVAVCGLSEEILCKLQEIARSSQMLSRADFYKCHMVDIYAVVLDSVQEKIENTANHLKPNYQMVLNLMTKTLKEIGLSSKSIEYGQMITIGYLREEEPTVQKVGAMAAAIFKAIDNYALWEESISYTEKEVAELLAVSVSEMRPHIQSIENLLERVFTSYLV